MIDRWLVLRTIATASKAPGKTLLQKTFFLAESALIAEGLGAPSFFFYRYKFGPYSRELESTLDDLYERGLLNANRTLTPRGRHIVDHWNKFFVQQAPAELRAAEKRLEKTLHDLEPLDVRALEEQVYKKKIKPPGGSRTLTVREIPQRTPLLKPTTLQLKAPELHANVVLDLHADVMLTDDDVQQRAVVTDETTGDVHRLLRRAATPPV